MTSALFRSEPEGRGAGAKLAPPGDDGARRSRSEPDLSSRRPQRAGPAGPSVIGPGTEIVGRVEMRGDLRVEGRIEGTISVEGEVVVSEQGSVDGEIEADDVVVEGRIEGGVRARGSARFRSGCRMRGDVRSPVVEVQEGGTLDGRIDMTGEGAESAGATAGAKPGLVARGAASAADSRGSENGEDGSATAGKRQEGSA